MVIQGVLAQVPDPEQAVAEIHRVLADRGFVYAEDAFLQPVRGGASDFHRWTHQGYRRLFAPSTSSTAASSAGRRPPWRGRGRSSCSAWRRRGRPVTSSTPPEDFSAFWLKYLDRFLVRRPAALDAASGLFFLGRKSARVLSDRGIVASYPGAVRG